MFREDFSSIMFLSSFYIPCLQVQTVARNFLITIYPGENSLYGTMFMTGQC
jgi:hypothetical protein